MLATAARFVPPLVIDSALDGAAVAHAEAGALALGNEFAMIDFLIGKYNSFLPFQPITTWSKLMVKTQMNHMSGLL